jgi:hypothetical protein
MGSEIFVPALILILLPVAILVGVLVRLTRKAAASSKTARRGRGAHPFQRSDSHAPGGDASYESDEGRSVDSVDNVDDAPASDSPLQSFVDSAHVSLSEPTSSFDASGSTFSSFDSSSSSSSDSGSSSSSSGGE